MVVCQNEYGRVYALSSSGKHEHRMNEINKMNEARPIHREVLPNGLVIVTEPMPHVRSVSVGIWLHSGSRSESAARNGIAHFIEHMVFKGTERRSAEEIARSIDSIGGMMDAFTAKEMVSFNAKVLDEHLPVAWEVLSDLALHPLFDAEEIAREKQVVLEEIKMDQDNPESVAHEMLVQNFWSGHPLGRPILGTPETVGDFSRAAVAESHREVYVPGNMLVTAAGHLEHAKVVDLVANALARCRRENFPRRKLYRKCIRLSGSNRKANWNKCTFALACRACRWLTSEDLPWRF